MAPKDLATRLEKIEGLLTDIKTANDRPYDLNKAAEYLDLRKSTLYKLTSTSAIGHFKPGKKIYFEKNDLDSWWRQNRCAPAGETKG